MRSDWRRGRLTAIDQWSKSKGKGEECANTGGVMCLCVWGTKPILAAAASIMFMNKGKKLSYISPPFFFKLNQLLMDYMPAILQWLLFIFFRGSVLMLRTKLSVRVHTIIGECRVCIMFSFFSSLLLFFFSFRFPSSSLSPSLSLPTPPFFFPPSLSPCCPPS